MIQSFRLRSLLIIFLLYGNYSRAQDASLLSYHTIKTFSAASSIQVFNNYLYLVGDDENKVLLLDTTFQKVDSVSVGVSTGKKSKEKKMDFEASFITTGEGVQRELLVFASGSTMKRSNMVRIKLEDREGQILSVDTRYQRFLGELRRRISQVNIEGVALVDGYLIFANRGNYSNKKNLLITISYENFLKEAVDSLTVHELPTSMEKSFKGASELFYYGPQKILFLTFSDELTQGSYADGKIGNSSLAWIKNPQAKIRAGNFKLDGEMDLAGVHMGLKNQKIEGVCVRRVVNETYLLHLVSDNDDGMSTIFSLLISPN